MSGRRAPEAARTRSVGATTLAQAASAAAACRGGSRLGSPKQLSGATC
jgi:hypothetical protein